MAEELDDIKALWQKSKEHQVAPTITLDLLENYRPKTTLYWIKVILWIEFGLNLIMAPFVVPFMYNRGDSLWFIGFYIFIVIVYLIYYQFLIRSINHFTYDGDVIQSLSKVYRYLRFYLLHYKVVIWVSLLGGISYSLIDAIQNGTAEQGIPENADMTFWLIVVAISGAMLLVVGGIMHFLVHLIYGRKIKRLKGIVKSLNDT